MLKRDFSYTSLPWSSPIFYMPLSTVCTVISNVCSVMHFMLREQNQHLKESRVLCVCPLARHCCACHVAGCLAASPIPLWHQKEKLKPAQQSPYVCVCNCTNWGVCPSSLTLDVYLLHFVDLCNCLSELLCKLPELFSAWGAETHQLLLLWGKRAQHGDAMGIVWWEAQREGAFITTLILKNMDFSKNIFQNTWVLQTSHVIVAKNTCKPIFWG